MTMAIIVWFARLKGKHGAGEGVRGSGLAQHRYTLTHTCPNRRLTTENAGIIVRANMKKLRNLVPGTWERSFDTSVAVLAH